VGGEGGGGRRRGEVLVAGQGFLIDKGKEADDHQEKGWVSTGARGGGERGEEGREVRHKFLMDIFWGVGEGGETCR